MVDATQVQIRRGTQSQCEGMVPVEGEVICDLTNDTLRVGDGSKAGGHLMPNVARMQSGQYMFATAGGTGNAITVALSPAVAALVTGMEFRFLSVANNTGSVTLNLNGLGAVGLRKIQSGSPVQLDADDISSGVIYSVVYDGTYFVLLSGVGGGIVAPVAGSTHSIYYVLGSTEISRKSTSYVILDYQNYNDASWNIRAHASGSVQLSLQHKSTESGSSDVNVALNGASIQNWSTISLSYVTRTRTINVSGGDVITIRHKCNNVATTSYIRNIIIKSSTPAYGAISG